MRVRRQVGFFVAAGVLCASLVAARDTSAQQPAPPPAPAQTPGPQSPDAPLVIQDPPKVKVWRGSLAGGLALTSGNSDTSTVNAAYELIRDAKGRVVFKSTGLFIRGKKDEDLTVDRTAADMRLDYRLTPRFFTFGQLSYQRDRFRQIDYLLAPTIGVGAQVIDKDSSKLVVDTSLGTAVERNVGVRVRTSPAVAFGERLTQQINERARITQSATALLKADDFGDVLYTFGIGIAASITSRSELKAEVLDNFKNQPVARELKRNDLSVLVSILYKF
jgi:putative salt-induced outer membrane protein YdiY